MDLRTSEIAKATGGVLSGPDVKVSGATIDSRRVLVGQLFVPVVAARDGHDFVVGAIAAGAAAYLTSRGPFDGVAATAVEVSDTVAAASQATVLEAGYSFAASSARTQVPSRVMPTGTRS